MVDDGNYAVAESSEKPQEARRGLYGDDGPFVSALIAQSAAGLLRALEGIEGSRVQPAATR